MIHFINYTVVIWVIVSLLCWGAFLRISRLRKFTGVVLFTSFLMSFLWPMTLFALIGRANAVSLGIQFDQHDKKKEKEDDVARSL